MQMHYYTKFPYWGTYYAMLIIPKPFRDWGYNLAKKHSDLFLSKDDIDKKMKPTGSQ